MGVKLKFLGAAGTVTGSSYLLSANSGDQLLIDLGLYQGPAKIEQLSYLPLEADCSQITGVVLTHAHLDHCGRMPIIERLGFTGNVYMTAPTAELTQLTLLDSAKINQEDHPDNYLYDREQVFNLTKRFKIVGYDQPFSVGAFKITLRDAGHIIGSASVEAEVEGKKIVFSGDLGNTPEDLTNPTRNISSADVVVMESTYGDKTHPVGEAMDILRAEINTIESANSTLLIPAFSLERTQELLHIISHLKAKKLVKRDTAVYLDSPMAQKATNIYKKYRSFLNLEVKKDFVLSNPFTFPGLHIVRDHEHSINLDQNTGAKVIIAGSGMMTGGRIVHHAKYFLPFSSTRLLFVGYQGEETLGRQILSGEKEVEIDGERIHINAQIIDTQVMSSHADQPRLISWLRSIKNVRKVILTHGEDIPRGVLAHTISAELAIGDVDLPVLNQEIEL